MISKPITTNQKEKKMKSIDKSVLAGYNAGIEKDRLRSGVGLIEFARTKEILLEHLPKPPAVIYDIGGGYGEYSWWLTSLGYEVHLFDLSETNIEMSKDLAAEFPGMHLKSATVCDARSIPRKDKSADAILFMGPLYSITEYEERILAIKESYRLLKGGGIIFSAALNRYSVLLHCINVYHKDGAKKGTALDNPEVIAMIERELKDGCHINPERKILNGLGSSHLHSAKELRTELSIGGFVNTTIHGVIGGAWFAPDLDELWKNKKARNVLLTTVRLLDTYEDIIGISGHLLAVSRKE